MEYIKENLNRVLDVVQLAIQDDSDGTFKMSLCLNNHSIAFLSARKYGNTYRVSLSAAVKTFGSCIYSFAMMYATDRGLGLSSDDPDCMSLSAMSLWDKISKSTDSIPVDIVIGELPGLLHVFEEDYLHELLSESFFNQSYQMESDSIYSTLLDRGFSGDMDKVMRSGVGRFERSMWT